MEPATIMSMFKTGTDILSTLGGMFQKGRPQWRDLEFMSDASDRLLPAEIERQNKFLAGVTGQQAASYNQYQDATYQQQVGRETAGIKSMSAELGMTPWELAGQGGSAAPLPAPNPQQPQRDSGAMLSAVVPMQVAQQQAKTAVATTAMNNQTALEIERLRQGGGEAAKAGIANTKQQTAESASRVLLNQANEGLIGVQTRAQQNKMVLDTVATLLSALPQTTVDTGLVRSTHYEGGEQIKEFIGKYAALFEFNNNDDLAKSISKMPKQQFDNMMEDLMGIAGLLAKGGQMAKGAAGFLGGVANTARNTARGISNHLARRRAGPMLGIQPRP